MKYSYYPGCTLRNKAKDLDEYARASARALGFELEEIEDWHWCVCVYPLGTDEIATMLFEQDANSLGLNVIWCSDYSDIPSILLKIAK